MAIKSGVLFLVHFSLLPLDDVANLHLVSVVNDVFIDRQWPVEPLLPLIEIVLPPRLVLLVNLDRIHKLLLRRLRIIDHSDRHPVPIGCHHAFIIEVSS